MPVDFLSDFVAGWAAGATGLVIGHPLDTIKVRVQALKYSSVIQCAVQTMRQEAASGFYKGMLFPFLATGFLHSIYFGGYRVTIQLLNPKVAANSHYVPNHSHVLIGSLVGGVLQWIPSCPIEVVKVKLQVQKQNTLHLWQLTSQKASVPKDMYRNPFHCFVKVFRQQGLFSGLYKGGGVMLFRDLFACCFYLPVYELLYRHLNPDRSVTCLASSALAGGIAGVTSWFSVLPLDLVKSRLQADDTKNPKYTGVWQCAKESFRSEGFSVFYRGWFVVAARAFPVNAVLFITYDQILRFIYQINGAKNILIVD